MRFIKNICCALPLVFTLSGCVIADRVKESDDRAAYLRYRQETDKLNTEREKAGLKPVEVVTQEDWLRSNSRR